MKKLKICVYAICKNEARFADLWMDSMEEAGLVVVTDTGSDDDTVNRLRKRGATVFIDEIKPWRFDVARNVSMRHIPEDADICVCTDLDELFKPGWREKLENAWLKHKPKSSGAIAKSGKYLYNWSLKSDGSPDVQFNYFKIHERHDFLWRCPVHEYIQYVGSLPLETVFIDGMVLNHHPDPNKPRSSYLPLLEMAVMEAPNDVRMRYYLGREYMYKGEWQKCIDTLNEYLTMPSAVWNEERCAAMRWIAKAYYNIGDIKDAYIWYQKAVAEAPHMREPYVEFSKMCYELKDWPMTLLWAQEALKIQEKSQTYVNMGYCWDYTPDDLSAIAAYNLNMMDCSCEHAKKALEYAPDNQRLKRNLEIIESAKKLKVKLD